MSRARRAIALPAALALAAGGWAGFARFGLLPPLPGPSGEAHGALIVTAIATLVGLERAIAMQRSWPYAAPALSAAAGLGVIAGLSPAPFVVCAGALVLVVAAAVGAPASPRSARLLMGAGALAWLAGALLWALGEPALRAVPWWVAFLVLTIAAERIELSRALRPSSTALAVAIAFAALLLIGAAATLLDPVLGLRLLGGGALGLAVWLAVRDRPPRASRRLGLPRFIATAIALAYGWLAVGSVYLLVHDGAVAGWRYDAMVHTVFGGFALTMIVAHAPIVLPAVLGVALVYRRRLYVPLALLTGSVLLRTLGDALERGDVRGLGAAGVALALGALAVAVASSARPRGDLRTRAAGPLASRAGGA